MTKWINLQLKANDFYRFKEDKLEIDRELNRKHTWEDYFIVLLRMK